MINKILNESNQNERKKKVTPDTKIILKKKVELKWKKNGKKIKMKRREGDETYGHTVYETQRLRRRVKSNSETAMPRFQKRRR